MACSLEDPFNYFLFSVPEKIDNYKPWEGYKARLVIKVGDNKSEIIPQRLCPGLHLAVLPRTKPCSGKFAMEVSIRLFLESGNWESELRENWIEISTNNHESPKMYVWKFNDGKVKIYDINDLVHLPKMLPWFSCKATTEFIDDDDPIPVSYKETCDQSEEMADRLEQIVIIKDTSDIGSDLKDEEYYTTGEPKECVHKALFNRPLSRKEYKDLIKNNNLYQSSKYDVELTNAAFTKKNPQNREDITKNVKLPNADTKTAMKNRKRRQGFIGKIKKAFSRKKNENKNKTKEPKRKFMRIKHVDEKDVSQMIDKSSHQNKYHTVKHIETFSETDLYTRRKEMQKNQSTKVNFMLDEVTLARLKHFQESSEDKDESLPCVSKTLLCTMVKDQPLDSDGLPIYDFDEVVDKVSVNDKTTIEHRDYNLKEEFKEQLKWVCEVFHGRLDQNSTCIYTKNTHAESQTKKPLDIKDQLRSIEDCNYNEICSKIMKLNRVEKKVQKQSDICENMEQKEEVVGINTVTHTNQKETKVKSSKRFKYSYTNSKKLDKGQVPDYENKPRNRSSWLGNKLAKVRTFLEKL